MSEVNITKLLKDNGFNEFEVFIKGDQIRILVISTKFIGLSLMKRIDMLIDLSNAYKCFIIWNPLTPNEVKYKVNEQQMPMPGIYYSPVADDLSFIIPGGIVLYSIRQGTDPATYRVLDYSFLGETTLTWECIGEW